MKALRVFAIAAVAFGLATAADPWAYQHLVHRTVYDNDLGRMLRIAGFLPTWAVVSGALILSDAGALTARSPWRRWRGMLPFIAAVVAGALGELLKILLRRERPDAHAGAYVFRGWTDHPFSNAGLALPSSHAIVAFGALGMLSLMYPRARWIFYAVAIGCAATRVLAQAHFVSDVTLSAILGLLVAAVVQRWWEKREAAPLVDPLVG